MPRRIPFTFQIYRGDELLEEKPVTVDVPGVIKIGRLESSHVCLDDETVSRMHAVIEISGVDEIQVIDVGSAKGTMVNGQSVTKMSLHGGEEIVVGQSRLVVSVGESYDSAGHAPAAKPAATAPSLPAGLSDRSASSSKPTAEQPPVLAKPSVPRFANPVASPPAPFGGQAQANVPELPFPGAGSGAPLWPTSQGGSGHGDFGQGDSGSGWTDRTDGARAIEVTSMYQDTVIGVRQLDNPLSGRVGTTTQMLVFLGWGLFAVGLALAAIFGQPGFGGILLIAGLAMGVSGFIRRGEEQRSPHFVIGEAVSADVPLKNAAIPVPAFPLVEADSRGYALLFTSGMSGDVALGSGYTSLNDLVTSGQTSQSPVVPGAYRYDIPMDARLKVDVGDNTFLVHSVPAPAPLAAPAWAQILMSSSRSHVLSVGLHAMLLFLIFAVPPDAKSLSLDLFNADNRFLKYLVKPAEEKDDQIPEWLKKKGPGETMAGEAGQRHKGAEGQMGKKDSKQKNRLYGLKGPADNPDPHLAREFAEKAAQNAGVLGVLGGSSGSHLASIFGRDTALGRDAEDALGGLVGDQIGESYGVGGLGLAGTGRGGGGTGEGTIGLGRLGTIGKGGLGGTGSKYGTGVGRLGGHVARAPQILAGQAEVRGSLDKEIIRRVIRRHINEVKHCYSQELQLNESLGGRVVVQFTISGTGTVVVSTVQSSTVGNARVERCIAMAVRRWLFPKPKGGGIVIVSYPFVLRSAGA